MSRLFLSALDVVNRVVCWIVGLLFAAATLSVLLQVCVRFILPKLGMVVAAPWTEELARYLVTWSVFLGVGVLCRNARLIAVEIFTVVLPAGKVVKITGVLVSMVFFVILVQAGFAWTSMSAIELSPVMRIPMTWFAASMPVGSVLASINLVGFLVASAVGETEETTEAAKLAEVAGD